MKTHFGRVAGKFLLASGLTLCLVLAAATGRCDERLYQYSTLDALAKGLFDGDLTVARLKGFGTFGLGTLNGLDGELILLDGQAYHVRAGGEAEVVPLDARIPFAQAVYFKEDIILRLGRIDSLDALNQQLAASLPSSNIFYAIRIQGRFNGVKARAVDRQNKPYPSLAEALAQQVVVKFRGEGTLVGFRSPNYGKGVWVPGFHWHFLSGDHLGGGHVLDCSFEDLEARVDVLRGLNLELPATTDFDGMDFESPPAHGTADGEK